LSECLNNEEFPTIQAAIAQYEKQMLRRAAEVTKMTLDSTEMLHAEDAAERLIKMFSDFEGH
jgi:hypothetical protein